MILLTKYPIRLMNKTFFIAIVVSSILCGSAFAQDKRIENPSVFIDTPMDLLCLQKHSPSDKNSTDSQSAFSGNEILDISIKDNSSLLSSSSKLELELIIVKALQAWNYACYNCSYNNLILVKIGHNYYMNSLLAALLRKANVNDKSEEQKLQWLHPFIIDLDLDIILFRCSKTSYGINYARLDSNDTAIGTLCNTPDWWHLQPSIVEVRKYLCQKIKPSKSKFIIELNQNFDKLNRQGGSREVAYGDKSGIVSNTQNFYFTGDNGATLFGNLEGKEIKITPLITHEMGHWIGINGHIDNSIIAKGNFNVPCIDDNVFNVLKSTIDRTKGKPKPTEIFFLK